MIDHSTLFLDRLSRLRICKFFSIIVSGMVFSVAYAEPFAGGFNLPPITEEKIDALAPLFVVPSPLHAPSVGGESEATTRSLIHSGEIQTLRPPPTMRPLMTTISPITPISSASESVSSEVLIEPPARVESFLENDRESEFVAGHQSGYYRAVGDFGAPLSGFAPPLGALSSWEDFGDELEDGLGISGNLVGGYDTNPSMGYDSLESGGGGSSFLQLGGGLRYRSGGSALTYGMNYQGSYTAHFGQSALNGYKQDSGLVVNYQGGPLNASFNFGFGVSNGANRYYEAVVDQISLNYGLGMSYQISSKTSVTGNLSQSSNLVAGSFSNTGNSSLGLAALWQYSPLTQFGPGISYTSQSNESGGGRTTLGPTMTLNYQLSQKVSLNSLIGLDFADFDDGASSDPSMSGAISLVYRASALWGVRLAVNRSTQASPIATDSFDELTSISVAYTRKILRASWMLGASYQFESAQTSSQSMGNGGSNQNYLSLTSSLGMPIFAGTCDARLYFSYSDQSGEAENAFKSTQMGIGIRYGF